MQVIFLVMSNPFCFTYLEKVWKSSGGLFSYNTLIAAGFSTPVENGKNDGKGSSYITTKYVGTTFDASYPFFRTIRSILKKGRRLILVWGDLWSQSCHLGGGVPEHGFSGLYAHYSVTDKNKPPATMLSFLPLGIGR